MAEQENSNKRAYIGIALFAMLILANLIIRGTKSRTPQVAPAETLITTTSPINVPVTQTVNAIPLPLETTGIDQQILLLNQQAEDFGQRMTAVPTPFLPPDLGVSLQTTGIDRLIWELSNEEIQQIASETVIIASMPRVLAILGEFIVNGRKKMLIREDEKVYLLNASQTYNENEIMVIDQNEGTFTVRDSSGQNHALSPFNPDNSDLKEVIATLKGLSRKQSGFNLMPGSNASQTLPP